MKHINQEMYIESRKDKYINRYSFLFLHFTTLISFLFSHQLCSLDNIQITECHVAILNQELNKNASRMLFMLKLHSEALINMLNLS